VVVPYYPDEPWEVAHRHIRDGKLRVILQSPWDPERFARFKYGFELGVDPDQRGPLSANERIGYEIGEMLGLPVRPIQFYNFHGMRGHLAWAISNTARPWNQLDWMIRRQPQRFLRQPDIFARMLVYDIFIYNHDRHEGNILVSARSHQGAHDLYLIDHDLALFGQYGKWKTHRWWHAAWDNPAVYIRTPDVRGAVARFEQLEPTVAAIEAIPGTHLAAMVDGIVDLGEGYLSHFEAHTIKQMLARRQEKLRGMLERWCLSEALF
jgi:hypothetical protein